MIYNDNKINAALFENTEKVKPVKLNQNRNNNRSKLSTAKKNCKTSGNTAAYNEENYPEA